LVLKGLRTLIELNKNFKLRLDRLKLPLIFSIMAMLSNDKVNLFDDNFMTFMEYLEISDYNRTEEKAQYAAFIIDKMIIQEKFDYRKYIEIKYMDMFEQYMHDKDNEIDYYKSKQNVNFLRQRRLFISPTVDYYQPS